MIFDLSQKNIVRAFDVGIELGYFYQFGIFSYIMSGIINQSVIYFLIYQIKFKCISYIIIDKRKDKRTFEKGVDNATIS